MAVTNTYSREIEEMLPKNRELFYGGRWNPAISGEQRPVISPANQASLGTVHWAGVLDVDAAVRAAHEGFKFWRATKPLERGKVLREAASILRSHRRELALIDAIDCGNPVRELVKDVDLAASSIDYFAGLVTEVKGQTLPMGEGILNYTVREPLGVIARISAFNHPMLFAATKMAAPLAAGNAVILKSPDQAPLSTLRLAELWSGLFAPGVFSVLSGGRECGGALVGHPLVSKVGLIGSVPTGKAIARAAADGLKKVTLELGGKNAFVACPDTDVAKVADGIVKGMNFAWCGQSCGSTSRAFVHAEIYDAVVEAVRYRVESIRPGLPSNEDTEMGCLISESHSERVWSFIHSASSEGARLVTGARAPDDPGLSHGFYILPTVFCDVTPEMRIAREEIFGPVLSILKWHEEEELIEAVNAVEYGLTAAIWTSDLATAHRIAARIQAGFIWINNSSAHFAGAPFGGMKHSGIGREESIEELLDCTDVKNVNVTLTP
ncbi:aldehyde dehydrogenase family protein [Rhizobium sp. WYJ-E13]|uniref:aldehyde dehydrogenase family protein n=1 Tax=Rhizobium sp. WYJ-E13 TaxID=2849093 RepID=UPI001C1EA8E7|nr:aldehyde dehydrogenase family protein [Rhizobium sp. WYJ-E13]QWW72301.1 aldehyde dehydrogenase family protein [Rhizobium sp. WYJ-E13]